MFQRLSKAENGLLSFLTLSVNDILVGRESLDHGPFFRTLYIYSLTLMLKPTTWKSSFYSLPLWSIAGVCAHARADDGKSCLSLRSSNCDFIFCRYPRKKFWIEKPISPPIKKQTQEFSDKLLSLEKGLKGFHGKGRGSEPRIPSFFLYNVSLGFDCGRGFSEFLALVHVTHTTQGHWGGNLSKSKPESIPHDSLRMLPRLKQNHSQ